MLKRMGMPLFLPSSQRVWYWSMEAKFMASHTGPRPREPSPMLQTTMPFLPLHFLNRAAPVAMPALPPTMALLGYTPKGRKKACMEPPMPLWKPFSRAKISLSAP